MLPASADVKGANEGMPKDKNGVNNLLKSMGLPPMEVPSGTSPLVEYIGTAPAANIDGQKQKARPFDSTLLVRFVYPSGWLTEAPTITDNGEAGNIAANNYQKGDGATFASAALPSGKSIDSLGKEFFKGFVGAQMSNDVYEDVKVSKLKTNTMPDGVQLAQFDFTYTLLTRAGFTVDRKGVGSAMVVNDVVVGVVAATTALRYKDLAEQLNACTTSFRAYSVKTPAFPGSLV